MANYHAFHHTTIGHSHVLKNTCCEDASCCISEGDVHVAVVSDGHGDPACFRSQIGSLFLIFPFSISGKMYEEITVAEHPHPDPPPCVS